MRVMNTKMTIAVDGEIGITEVKISVFIVNSF